jgi:hypothetical protein
MFVAVFGIGIGALFVSIMTACAPIRPSRLRPVLMAAHLAVSVALIALLPTGWQFTMLFLGMGAVIAAGRVLFDLLWTARRCGRVAI